MKTSSATLAFSALVALVPAAVAQMTINTPPSVVECEPVQFAWNGGSPPYYLSLVPDGQPAGPALKQFPKQSDTSYTWMDDLPAGTAFNVALKDSTGVQAFSAPVTVQKGTDQSCLNTKVDEEASGPSSAGASPAATQAVPLVAGSSSALGSTGASIHATTSAAATPGSSAAPSPTPAKAAAGANSASTSSPVQATSKNAARGVVESATHAAMGIAGVMGLVGAALL
ncbi:hypothetical protein OF83DRAFT_435277 [Amylostereum chailletii]|nr:hypothetical protein OF83DRAFT_435277 [Amylostereum chailletii]